MAVSARRGSRPGGAQSTGPSLRGRPAALAAATARDAANGARCAVSASPRSSLRSARPHLHRRRWHGALGCRHGHQDQETQLEAVATSFVPAAAALMTVSAREPCPEHANHLRMPLQRATTEVVPAGDDDASSFSWSLVVASRESCWLTTCGFSCLLLKGTCVAGPRKTVMQVIVLGCPRICSRGVRDSDLLELG